MAYVIVNKRKGTVRVRHEYHPIPSLTESLAEQLDVDAELIQGGEVVLPDRRNGDQRYERLLVLIKEDGATSETLTESLVGFPKGEKLLIYPISAPPYMDIAPESWFPLELTLSAAGGCAEALQVIVEGGMAYLLEAVEHLRLIDRTLAVTDKIVGGVVTTLDPLLSPVTSTVDVLLSPVTGPVNALTGLPLNDPLLKTLSKPSKLVSAALKTPVHLVSKVKIPARKSSPHPESQGTVSTSSTSAALPAEEVAVKGEGIPVRIRHGRADGLHELERLARDARLATISSKLGSVHPKIALTTSGGGMRAMIASCGFFTALKEMGVLDVTLYQCGVSGSTWSTSKWMTSLSNSLVAYKDLNVPDCWSSDVDPQAYDKVDISSLLDIACNKAFHWDNVMRHVPMLLASRSLLKVYSVLLAEKMNSLGADYHVLQSKSLSGKFPIPLCTAVYNDDDGNLKSADYSPFEIGSTSTNTYFEVDYFQIRNFKAPLPPAVHELMALWGSAFYCKLNQMVPGLPDDLKELFGNISLLPGAKVVNANYNRVDETTGNLLPYANQKYLFYKDAGIETNTSTEPLLRPEREVDVLVVLDADGEVATKPFNELVKSIPAIKKAIPENPTFPYVFPSTPDYPTIVYIPVIKNSSFNSEFDPVQDCGTFRFDYDKDTATKLFGLSHYLTIQAKDSLRNIISSWK